MVQTKCGFDTTPQANGSALLETYGPTLKVNIGFDPNYVIGVGIPTPGITLIDALVDTGASESCIDNLLAAQIKLPVVDRRRISGISGSNEVNVYMAQVHIPSLNFTIYGAFAGVDLKAGGLVHNALIGRTFLRHFTMTYEGKTGMVIISSD